MCTHYTPTARDRLRAQALGVDHLPERDWPPEVFPGYEAPVVVARPMQGVSVALARFGLMPRWSRDRAHAASVAKGTYNARVESVSAKPSFRGPWHERQFALVPMQHYFDPCWEDAASHGGRSVRWRIAMASGEPFACAALWEQWRATKDADSIVSFTLLTVNADDHALCRHLHRPGDEKRMPAIIRQEHYAAWLHASTSDALALIRAFPAEELVGGPDEPRARQALPPQLPLFS